MGFFRFIDEWFPTISRLTLITLMAITSSNDDFAPLLFAGFVFIGLELTRMNDGR